MPSFYDDIASIYDDIAPVAGVTVDYKRGTTVLVAGVVMIPGQTRTETATEPGISVAVDGTDFIVKTSLITAAVPPQPGDLIIFGAKTYRVSKVSGDRCYRYCDPLQSNVRIHTKLNP